MRLWKVAAFAAIALGSAASTLVLLARLAGIRVAGFGEFYSTTVQELVGISVLFLLGALLLLADRVAAIEASVGRIDATDVDQGPEPDRTGPDGDDEGNMPLSKVPDAPVGGRAKEPLIRLAHLTKTYELGPVKVHALREASLDIRAGSVTVILGPSGSGKTTLLNLLGGIDRATSGNITFDGTDVTRLEDARLVDYRRERVGFVFQFFNLIPSLTARENVALAAELVPEAAQVEKVLRMVGLGERMDHFPAELSGGEQQRVAIARALVKNPPLLLCDEPTGELDYATGIKILEILKGVAHGDGRAVVVVTHNATIAEMADQVVRLRGGRIDQVTNNPEPVPPAMLRW